MTSMPGFNMHLLLILLWTESSQERLYSNFKQRPGPKRGADQPVGPIAYEPKGRR